MKRFNIQSRIGFGILFIHTGVRSRSKEPVVQSLRKNLELLSRLLVLIWSMSITTTGQCLIHV